MIGGIVEPLTDGLTFTALFVFVTSPDRFMENQDSYGGLRTLSEPIQIREIIVASGFN